ncbi:DUF2163 domain-containing protein [Pseudooceanicola sp.]|uniref:DUF2163 domain-containing protein n=1 Tax=Pseudooceanicola sp. TaxID=1914328 RepID=UPI00262F9FF7|nr:DUF2163 domain-containing protein [Pseudooceanicola sp.]MDF1854911.1 DUF2163 domain-containing protein [Pseudooceanicola sp.]
MSFHSGLKAHLDTGATTLCHAWQIRRVDGVVLGFTDHDLDLNLGGVVYRADTGLSATALQQGTGLAVDNSEALGALSDAALSEADIEAGRFDAAELTAWLVNWADTDQRQLVFRATLGEIRRAGGAFHAELRGLTEALNRPLGRVYQKPCPAVLGDAACGVNLAVPGYRSERPVEVVDARLTFSFESLPGFDIGWFQRGRVELLSGEAKGLSGAIKRDRFIDGRRVIELWQPLRAAVAPGDMIRLDAGCDKRFETCRLKFNNVLNFRGFPDIPGEDWMLAYPSGDGAATGGSRR